MILHGRCFTRRTREWPRKWTTRRRKKNVQKCTPLSQSTRKNRHLLYYSLPPLLSRQPPKQHHPFPEPSALMHRSHRPARRSADRRRAAPDSANIWDQPCLNQCMVTARRPLPLTHLALDPRADLEPQSHVVRRRRPVRWFTLVPVLEGRPRGHALVESLSRQLDGLARKSKRRANRTFRLPLVDDSHRGVYGGAIGVAAYDLRECGWRGWGDFRSVVASRSIEQSAARRSRRVIHAGHR